MPNSTTRPHAPTALSPNRSIGLPPYVTDVMSETLLVLFLYPTAATRTNRSSPEALCVQLMVPLFVRDPPSPSESNTTGKRGPADHASLSPTYTDCNALPFRLPPTSSLPLRIIGIRSVLENQVDAARDRRSQRIPLRLGQDIEI